MPHSSLVYRDLRPSGGQTRATVIALHGGNGNLDDVVPLAQALGSDIRIVAPESARGVYNFRTMVAHNWYGWSHAYRPEPASFGDSLAQIERFIYDVRERAAPGEPARPIHLGYDQGAVLALTAALALPDLLSGVMAVCGSLPQLPEDDLFPVTASDLPVMLVSAPKDPLLSSEVVEQTASRLRELGLSVTSAEIPSARKLDATVADELSRWLQVRLRSE
jgi:predicted esterase